MTEATHPPEFKAPQYRIKGTERIVEACQSGPTLQSMHRTLRWMHNFEMTAAYVSEHAGIINNREKRIMWAKGANTHRQVPFGYYILKLETGFYPIEEDTFHAMFDPISDSQ